MNICTHHDMEVFLSFLHTHTQLLSFFFSFTRSSRFSHSFGVNSTHINASIFCNNIGCEHLVQDLQQFPVRVLDGHV